MDFFENYGRKSVKAQGFYNKERDFEYALISPIAADMHECCQVVTEALQSVADNQLPAEAYLVTVCNWLQTRIIDGDTIIGGAHVKEFYEGLSFKESHECNISGPCGR